MTNEPETALFASDNIPTTIGFYRASKPYGFLSNLYLCAVKFEGRVFRSAEHAYQFGKSNKIDIAEWIDNAPTPSLCAQSAHALLVWQVRSDWSQIKLDRMRAVVEAKFDQNPVLGDLLLDTHPCYLREESTIDNFWGVGRNGTGANMLGVILMELRLKLWNEREAVRANLRVLL